MRRTATAFLVALLASFAPNAMGTVARAVSFDQKVENAESIVLGRCIRKHSALDPSGRWIVTYSTFEVSKTYKGTPATEVTVVTPGGTVDGLHQQTIGVPSFSEGDLNVLFISNNKTLGPSVLFFDQGAYRVSESAGEAVVSPVESDLVVIDTQTGKARSLADEGIRSLSEFEREVGRLVQRRLER